MMVALVSAKKGGVYIFYTSLEPFFDKSWQLESFEKIK